MHYDGKDDQRGIHVALSTFILILSPIIYCTIKNVNVPMGRFSHSTSGQKWGPTLSPKLAWFLFESPNLIWSMFGYVHRDKVVFDANAANAVLFAMFVIHYVNRCVVYPLRMAEGSSSVNVTVLFSAFLFCCINGFLQVENYCQLKTYPAHYHTTAKFILGVLIWIVGFMINLHSDSILRNLRTKDTKATIQKKTYQIPHGGFFEIVSCANFFGEIVEWFGYAVASSSFAGWSFWIFVCANLIPRGIAHHQWYLEKFEDYPKRRYAVIPFVT